MRLLTNEILRNLLPLPAILAAVEEAARYLERHPGSVPQRLHLDHGNNTLLVMPAFSGQHYGVKLVSIAPHNKTLHLPVTNGVMVLNDAATGLPRALLNAARLTALRTGALGALGLKYTTPETTDSIGLIGAGVQGLHQALFAPVVRPVRTIFCLKRSDAGFDRLCQAVAEKHPEVRVVPCPSPEAVLAQTDAVIAATTSATPVLPNDPDLLRGKHFISIGSYKPEMQELPDAVYALAGHIITDSDHARTETGDILHPLHQQLVRPEAVFSIGKLITGARQLDVARTTVYKSAGMAIFDLFVAAELLRAAEAQNLGLEFEL